MAEVWVDADEVEDVAASVRHVLRCWPEAGADPQIWKWIALALHSALQGACVCHLLTTARPLGAVDEKNAARWMAYFENPVGSPPPTRLMSLPDLLATIRREKSAGDGRDDVVIAIDDDELAWLQRFHTEIRNQLVHFEPMGWAVEVSGLPGLAKLIARIIADVLAYGWGFRHKDEAWRERLAHDLNQLEMLGEPLQTAVDHAGAG
jgi:hypothetical protein